VAGSNPVGCTMNVVISTISVDEIVGIFLFYY